MNVGNTCIIVYIHGKLGNTALHLPGFHTAWLWCSIQETIPLHSPTQKISLLEPPPVHVYLCLSACRLTFCVSRCGSLCVLVCVSVWQPDYPSTGKRREHFQLLFSRRVLPGWSCYRVWTLRGTQNGRQWENWPMTGRLLSLGRNVMVT